MQFSSKFIYSLTACGIFFSPVSIASPAHTNIAGTVAMGTLTVDQTDKDVSGSTMTAPDATKTAATNETASTKQNPKKKKNKSKSGGLENESPEDMHLFQLKPTILNEEYYASGRNEKSQKTSPTLPPGAPIPDEDNYVMPPTKAVEKKGTTAAATNTELHSALIENNLAQSLKKWSKESNDSHQLTLDLQVTESSEELVNKLKELHAQILNTGTLMTIKIPVRRIQSVTELKQINRISLHRAAPGKDNGDIFDRKQTMSPTLPAGSPVPDTE